MPHLTFHEALHVVARLTPYYAHPFIRLSEVDSALPGCSRCEISASVGVHDVLVSRAFSWCTPT